MQLLKKAVQEQENLPVAYQYLGGIAYARGNTNEARKLWQRCLEWEPSNIEAARGLRILLSRESRSSGARGRPAQPRLQEVVINASLLTSESKRPATLLRL